MSKRSRPKAPPEPPAAQYRCEDGHVTAQRSKREFLKCSAKGCTLRAYKEGEA